jgi:hypothetical protein
MSHCMHTVVPDTALVTRGKEGNESKTHHPEFLSSQVGNPNWQSSHSLADLQALVILQNY